MRESGELSEEEEREVRERDENEVSERGSERGVLRRM